MGRVCTVSFRDWNGMAHAVEVSAASLYEAAALGLRAFRGSPFAEAFQPGAATKLTVRVSAEEARHEVNVRQVETWLEGGGKNPREQALKTKIRQGLPKTEPPT